LFGVHVMRCFSGANGCCLEQKKGPIKIGPKCEKRPLRETAGTG